MGDATIVPLSKRILYLLESNAHFQHDPKSASAFQNGRLARASCLATVACGSFLRVLQYTCLGNSLPSVFTFSASALSISMKYRVHHDAAFKRKVIICAETDGNRAASRAFGESETCERDWRKQKERIFASKAMRNGFSGPKQDVICDDPLRRYDQAWPYLESNLRLVKSAARRVFAALKREAC